MCRYVPNENNGGPRGAKQGYWKTLVPGQNGWNRYDLNGNPISLAQAHNQNVDITDLRYGWTAFGFLIFGLTYSEPAW